MNKTEKTIILARKHVVFADERNPSAELCLTDAITLLDQGDLQHAYERALKSLAYSVGMNHPDYKKCL